VKRYGPGFLVAAAFIGPGTVTTASLAGANHGYTLAWAVLFATLATIVMQEMSARLGVVARCGLGEALRTGIGHPVMRLLVAGLVIVGIGIGNAAYQTGNVTGAALGLSGVLVGPLPVWTLGIGASAGLVLWTGSRERIAGVLTVLVVVMTLLFVVTALLVRPDFGALLRGLSTPSVPTGGLLTVIALVGTTVVPYNLFLHSAAAQQKWSASEPAEAVRDARRDTVLAVLLGGLVTLAILLTAVPFHASGTALLSAADMARQLEPLLGAHARWAFALGLFAAGFTSAVTAPLAAAWAVGGVLGWPRDLSERRNRAVWLSVLVIGTVLASVGRRPLEAIVVAQAANGLLLPLMAGFLLWAVNRRSLMGAWVNGAWANLLGGGVVLLTAVLGASQLWRVFGP
jgi:manganese transport protein